MIPPDPNAVIQAAAMTPAFIGAYARAPATLVFNGKRYSRDAARNAQERIWYLAALSQSNPKAVHNLAFLGVDEMARGFDETEVTTDSTVRAAQSNVDTAHAAVTDAQLKLQKANDDFGIARQALAGVEGRLGQARAEVAMREQQMRTVFNDVGDVISTLFTAGISKGVQKVDQQVRLDSARGAVTALEQQKAGINIDGAKQAVDSAQATLDSAKAEEKKANGELKKAQDVVRKRLRDAEEKARQQELAEEQKQKAADDAARRQAAADAAASAAQDSASDYANSEYGNEEDVQWNSSDFATSDPDAELGVPDYLDIQDQADLWGDEDYAVAMMEDTDEPMIGVNTVISPYSFDRYYSEYNLNDADPVWGVDTSTVVTGIIAGVLAAAPAVLKSVAPPPSKDASGADTSSSIDVDGFLAKIGVKKTINDAATAAGAGAGDKASDKANQTLNTWLWVGVGVAGLVVLAKVL